MTENYPGKVITLVNPPPPPSIPFRCRLGWHHWSKWSEVYEFKTEQLIYQENVIVGTHTITYYQQKRICPGCGKQEEQRLVVL